MIDSGQRQRVLYSEEMGKQQCTNLCLITQDQYDRVAPEEHFANESVFVHGFFVLALRDLRPHFFHIFQNHITMSVKRFHASKQFLVVS